MRQFGKMPPRSRSFKGSDYYLAPEMIRQEECAPKEGSKG